MSKTKMDTVKAEAKNGQLTSQTKTSAKKTKSEKILDQIEAEKGIPAPVAEAVTEGIPEETQIPTPAPETPVTKSLEGSTEASEGDQIEAEKEYGEKTLDELLAKNSTVEAFVSCSDAILEPAVLEAIYRRLTKSDKKTAPVLTKSTYVAVEGGVGPTKRVWEIAGNMKGAKRSEVLAACLAEGIGINTAKTQYQKFMEAGRGKLTGKKA